ncbi:MAG: hypothetical protein P8H93_01620 [Polaribacter sp.]|nr:hypothetical protein [Polaribacter sp.]
MKKSILLFFLVFSLKSYCQYFEAELYFINGTNKTGITRINILNDKVIFKKNKNTKKEKYNHKNSSKLILKKDSISHNFQYKKILGRRSQKLLESIIESSNLSLFAVITESIYLNNYGLFSALASTIVDADKIDYKYYILKNRDVKAVFFGNIELTSKKRLREIVKKQLKDCQSLVEKTENKEFKVKDIPDIIHYYNSNCSQIKS